MTSFECVLLKATGHVEIHIHCVPKDSNIRSETTAALSL